MEPPDADALPDVIAIALDVSRRLEQLRVAFVIGGSLASSVHGEPRSTLDIDIVADLRLTDVDRVVAAFSPEYYLDADVTRQAVRIGGSVNAVHIRAGVKVDFFVAGQDPFEAERLQHRIRVPLGPAESDALWVDTAEHAILRKLEWYRRGNEVSDRQWRDVLGIIATQGAALDRGRLEDWAERLGVGDLLERAFAQSRG
jgi:hypothetical protein